MDLVDKKGEKQGEVTNASAPLPYGEFQRGSKKIKIEGEEVNLWECGIDNTLFRFKLKGKWYKIILTDDVPSIQLFMVDGRKTNGARRKGNGIGQTC